MAGKFVVVLLIYLMVGTWIISKPRPRPEICQMMLSCPVLLIPSLSFPSHILHLCCRLSFFPGPPLSKPSTYGTYSGRQSPRRGWIMGCHWARNVIAACGSVFDNVTGGGWAERGKRGVARERGGDRKGRHTPHYVAGGKC